MTDPNYTHIAVVLDRSGSMNSIKDDMENGLNAFFEEQAKLPGVCLVDFHQFDTDYETVYQDKPVAYAKAVLKPRGLTALNDAIGKTAASLGDKLEAMEEDLRPGKVIVVVVTDGFENSSREWTVEDVKKVVETQENEFGWEFVFLGANMDAVAVGTGYGFNPGRTLTYDTSNVAAASASLTSYTTSTRSGVRSVFTDEDREENS